jgi:hypothetical protein
VIFIQRTFTSLVHAHAGRTQGIQTDKKQLAFFTPFNILANNFLPLNVALYALRHYVLEQENNLRFTKQ